MDPARSRLPDDTCIFIFAVLALAMGSSYDAGD